MCNTAFFFIQPKVSLLAKALRAQNALFRYERKMCLLYSGRCDSYFAWDLQSGARQNQAKERHEQCT